MTLEQGHPALSWKSEWCSFSDAAADAGTNGCPESLPKVQDAELGSGEAV